MSHSKNVYDDGNIPQVDLPRDAGITHAQNKDSDSRWCSNAKNCMAESVEPLPESTRPRKDGPGGN